MPRKPLDRLKDHAANHPELVTPQYAAKVTMNGVLYTLNVHGWWMHPAPDSTWPTTPMRVTDPAHKRRIEAALAEEAE